MIQTRTGSQVLLTLKAEWNKTKVQRSPIPHLLEKVNQTKEKQETEINGEEGGAGEPGPAVIKPEFQE